MLKMLTMNTSVRSILTKVQKTFSLITYGFGSSVIALECLQDNDMEAFWNELNLGWLDTYDERDPWNISGRDYYYSYIMSNR
jgi:hypothetical protein